MTPELRRACALSAHILFPDGEILNSGKAALFILRELGWRWLWALRVPPLIWLVEVGYLIFARNRPFFFGLFAALSSKRRRNE
jgi:predicted DCC family thiol-disulfide oxidoreductase YuxK